MYVAACAASVAIAADRMPTPAAGRRWLIALGDENVCASDTARYASFGDRSALEHGGPYCRFKTDGTQPPSVWRCARTTTRPGTQLRRAVLRTASGKAEVQPGVELRGVMAAARHVWR